MTTNTQLRTQTTYVVKGRRIIRGINTHVETRITAPSKDYARYIAHQRGMTVAECEVKK